jgi:hypothetical protein
MELRHKCATELLLFGGAALCPSTGSTSQSRHTLEPGPFRHASSAGLMGERKFSVTNRRAGPARDRRRECANEGSVPRPARRPAQALQNNGDHAPVSCFKWRPPERPQRPQGASGVSECRPVYS